MAQIIISCAQTSMLVMRNVHLGGFFRTILLFMYFFTLRSPIYGPIRMAESRVPRIQPGLSAHPSAAPSCGPSK